MKNAIFLGIDVGKESFDAAVATADASERDWARLPHRHFPVAHDSAEAKSEIEAWLAKLGFEGDIALVVLESTGVYSERLKGNLAPWPVAIVNPNQVKNYGASLGRRGKSDRIDAAIIALYAAKRQPKPKAENSHPALRDQTRLRQQYSDDQTMWKNRLEQTDDPSSRKRIKKTIAYLSKQIASIDKEMESILQDDPILSYQSEAIQAIPGIKKVVAPVLSAELGDLTTYSRNQLTAAGGLNPIPNQSGNLNKGSRMAKGGGKRVRRVLYLAARSLFRHKGPLGDHIRWLQSRGMSNACIIGIMMRKLLLLARAVMKNNGVYDPGKIRYQGVCQ